MFVAMGDPLYPSQYERIPNYEGFTPQSAVSSFNLPLIYDSTLTTPVSLGADSPVLASKPASSTIHWGREQSQMNYPMRDNRAIFSHNQNNNRMKSNAKDSTLSLQVPQSLNGDHGLGFPTYNMFDSPQIPCPPTPYFGSFGVSGAQVASPTPSLPSNVHSASQLSSASTPSMHHSIPLGQNNAPILIAPTPGQLRPSKRSHDSPIKTEQQHHGMPYHSRPLQQHEQSPNHFNPPIKRESPPLSLSSQKRRKQSDPMTPVFNQPHRMPSSDASAVEFHGSQSRFKPLAGNTQSPQPVMTEEEEFLIHLRKDREPKPDWKTTVEEFKAHTGKEFRIPALQMRYSRLNERLRVWSAKDINALTRSKAEFEKSKWESVANGMMKYDCEVKWSARACQQKYAELNPEELDEAPLELSPDPEAYSEVGRHNSYVNIGVQEYGMARQGHHHQQQHPQQQRQRVTPEGKSSREQSADVRVENYKNIQVDANNQLQLLRQQQQQQLLSKRMQLGQQQQEQQQHWGMGGQQ
ncbi:hypothetical protein V499_05232 [Pseudogymnoascus sp. VKM F-103]|nr:hypothetical protein V499_05232 [Pseudogymnoascus sp. VKM F-103]